MLLLELKKIEQLSRLLSLDTLINRAEKDSKFNRLEILACCSKFIVFLDNLCKFTPP